MLIVLKRLWQEEEAQNLSEYALFLLLVSLAVCTAVSSFAAGLSSLYGESSARLLSIMHHYPISGGLSGHPQALHTRGLSGAVGGTSLKRTPTAP